MAGSAGRPSGRSRLCELCRHPTIICCGKDKTMCPGHGSPRQWAKTCGLRLLRPQSRPALAHGAIRISGKTIQLGRKNLRDCTVSGSRADARLFKTSNKTGRRRVSSGDLTAGFHATSVYPATDASASNARGRGEDHPWPEETQSRSAAMEACHGRRHFGA